MRLVRQVRQVCLCVCVDVWSRVFPTAPTNYEAARKWLASSFSRVSICSCRWLVSQQHQHTLTFFSRLDAFVLYKIRVELFIFFKEEKIEMTGDLWWSVETGSSLNISFISIGKVKTTRKTTTTTTATTFRIARVFVCDGRSMVVIYTAR